MADTRETPPPRSVPAQDPGPTQDPKTHDTEALCSTWNTNTNRRPVWTLDTGEDIGASRS